MRQFPFTDRQLIILYELSHSDSITASALSLSLGVSVRTIKKEVKHLKDILSEYDTTIDSVSGVGYRISQDTSNEAILSSLFNSKFLKRTHRFYKSNYERVNHIVITLLFADSYIKLEDLANSMYIARSTINNDLKEVRSQLMKYEISLKSKPTYGVVIEGSESSIRNAILDFVFYSNNAQDEMLDNYFYKDLETVDSLYNTLVLLLEDYNISDYSIMNIARIVYVTNYRILRDEDLLLKSRKYQSSIMDVVNALMKAHEYQWSMAERVRLAQYIEVNIMYKKTSNQTYISLVEKVVTEIDHNFALDLSVFSEDNMLFAAHIEQMVNRLHHGTHIRNPLLYENLRKYLFASKLAITATKIIENEMQVHIPTEEFSFIVLYFQNILYRIKGRHKIAISLVDGGNYLEREVYRKEIENHFIMDDVVVLEEDKNNSDIRVSLRTSHDDAVISLQNKNYLIAIKKEILRLRKETIDWDKYLIKGSVVSNIECNNKEQLFDYIIEHFESINILKNQKVSRDDFISMELGSQILHFQDYGKALEKPIVFIGVLSRPIIFDKTAIKVVVHIKTKKDGDKDLASICNAISRWLNSENDLAKFIDNASLELFYDTIINYL